MQHVNEVIRSPRVMNRMLENLCEDEFEINVMFRLSKHKYAVFATPRPRVVEPRRSPVVN